MTKVTETFPEVEEFIKEFKTETDAQKAMRILSSIPARKWFVGAYISKGGARRCGAGHLLGCGFHGNHRFYDNAKKLLDDGQYFSDVNDGLIAKYQQTTPKKRVLALLQDMIKAGF